MTKIEWADMTINPVVGCSKCSPGCDNCYAERFAVRLAKNPKTAAKYAGVVDANGKWTGVVDFDVSCLLRFQKQPRRIFVGSMCDLFHDSVMDSHLEHIMGHIGLTKANAHHTFLLLTKRPERMRDFFARWKPYREMPNVWLGVTVCNQAEADEKIPVLLDTPAAKRFVSVEPMLGPVDLKNYLPFDCDCETCAYGNGHGPALDWVICGGETGPNARPMHPDWVRGLRDQCAAASTPFFFKGWGEWVTIEDVPGRAGYGDIPDMMRSSDIDHRLCLAKNGDLKVGTKGWHDVDPAIISGRCCPVGKRRSGRLLDGVEHNAFPEARP